MQVLSAAIVRRNVDIDFSTVTAGPWFPAGGPIELMFNACSLSFPPTERFFIAAVRDHQEWISDPALREQVRDFIFQEAMHNKVHLACNAMLARDYPNCRPAEQVTLVTFHWLGKLPRWFRLSLSSALEHFTFLVAESLLEYPDEFRSIMPQQVADMWLWHAVEESEHRAVCFDVHQAVLGSRYRSYASRIAGMLFATPLFLFVMITLTALVLGRGRPKAKHQIAVDPARKANGPERYLGRNIFGVLWQGVPWRMYFSYYRPSFHPSDHDNSARVAAWKERYPGFGLGDPTA